MTGLPPEHGSEPGSPGAWRPDFAPPQQTDATEVLPGAGRPPEPDSTRVLPLASTVGGGGTTVQPMPSNPASIPSAEGPAKPRSRTVMIAVIAVLAVLAVLIAGDRVANAVAANVIADNLQSELGTPAKPDVDIGGFPFVTQALSGSFSSVHVTADDATVQSGETTVSLAHLDATMTGITATDRYQTIVAGRGQADVLVDWAGVSQVAGQSMSYVADDRMQLDFTVPIGQLSISGHITGRPQLNADDQTITVADPQVTVANVDVPQAVVDAVSRIVLRPWPIPALPYDIRVTQLTVQPDGLLLSGTGEDIPLRGQ